MKSIPIILGTAGQIDLFHSINSLPQVLSLRISILDRIDAVNCVLLDSSHFIVSINDGILLTATN